jgi:murein DD-endopeptidase MepM/ murein hydrolase activator NlpD
MRESVASIVRRNAFRFAMTGIVGIWLSGCADATRFADSGNPFSNPFASAPSGDAGAPTPRVASTPLASAQPYKRSYAADARPSPSVSGGAPIPAPEATGSIRPTRPDPVGGSSVGWTAVGGSPVIVGDADDSATLSRRYGVPESALLSANGLRSRSDVHANMRIVIPVYNANGETKSARADQEERDTAKARRAAKADDEERDAAKARRTAKADDEERDTAKARRVKRESADDSEDEPKKSDRADPGQKKHKADAKKERDDDADAGDGKSDKKVAKADKPEKHEKIAKAEKEPAKSEKAAEAKPAPEVAKADPPKAAKKPEDHMPVASVAPSPDASAYAAENGQFRWPARGRIIQGFKSGGNDGINIALPEGTSVRAAEDGKVAYAGSALKGYGNLVLIRHSNGFVSAYANNGSLDVKQGETVKRGQVIAKSGATGDVSTPQLHFELRRGQTPVDPTSYLAGL